MKVRTRVAPSPTGIPHIGNTRTALYNFLFARQNKGKFIVRIEDTDKERLVPGAQEKILEIFRFLGLDWDEGPEVDGPFTPYIQSQRLPLYRGKAEELVKAGKAYYCFCDKQRLEVMRRKQQEEGKLPRYDRKCLNLSQKEVEANLAAGKQYVIRLKVPDDKTIAWQDLVQGKISFVSNELDDQVLLKSDGFPTYHLGVVVDDHEMGITHVLRGVEWISSTPKHILLYEAFGWELPVFGHLPIILGPDKAKLSKRHGAKSALDYRDEGYLPEAIVNFMAFLGWSYRDNSDLLSLKELVKVFDLIRVRRANPIFDLNKLKWFNGQWIRRKSDQELAKILKPYLKIELGEEKLLQLVPLVKERLQVLTDINHLIEFMKPDLKIDLEIVRQQSQRNSGEIKDLLSELEESLKTLSPWSSATIEESLRRLKDKYNEWTPREFFMTVRVVTLGFPVSPPLFESMAVLPKDLVFERLRETIKKLNG